ncbi:MAG: helicase-associated domain-containing protein [Mycobacteriales bacterium]
MARTGLRPESATPSFPVAYRLAHWADGRLDRLLALRPDLADPPTSDIAELAVRAGGMASVDAARRRLDEFSLQVLDALCLLPDPTPPAAVAALFGPQTDVADIERALDNLEDRALAFGRAGEWYRQPTLRNLVFEPAELALPLAELYRSHTGPAATEVAERIGVPPHRTVSLTLDAMAAHLSDPAVSLGLLQDAPPGAVELAHMLAAGPPRVRAEYEIYAPTDRTPVGWLVRRGLIIAVSWEIGVMPREVAVALRGGTPFPTVRPHRPVPPKHSGDVAAADRLGAERALQLGRDIAALVDDLAATPPKLLKGGGLGVREVRRLARVIARDERDTARLLELAGAAGLVAADWSVATVTPHRRYDDWLALDSPARWGWLVASWLRLPGYLSWAGALDERDKPVPPLAGHGEARTAPRQRQLLLAALADGGSRAAIIDLVLWSEPLLWADQSELPLELAGWVCDEAELLGLCADGVLCPAGRLLPEHGQRGPDCPAGPDSLEAAITALRRHAPPVVESFVLQADLTAVASGELAHSVRAELGLLADVESVGAATVYRFSEASLRRGFDVGRSAEEITEFLAAHASRGVPQPLSYLVTDLGRRFGQLRTGAVSCYLRADSPALLAEVLRGAKTARLGFRQIAPTVLVGSADPATVLATLRAAGYLPALEDGAGALVLTGPAPRRLPAPLPTARPRLTLVADPP